MLNFNLIPKEKKEEIKKRNFFVLILGIFKGLIISVFIILVIILNSYLALFYLARSQNEILNNFKSDQKTKKLIDFEKEIKEKNVLIDSVESTQLNIFYLAPPIEEISELIPDGVYIQTLLIERKIEGQSNQGAITQSSENEGIATTPSPTTTTTSSQEGSQTQKEYIEVNIKGVAEKREDVILLEEKLRSREKKVEGKNYLFKNLSSAPQNILKPSDTEFEFKFRLEKAN